MTGSASWWDDILAVFPDWQPQVEDAREIGDRVLLRVRAEGAGTGSGIDVDRTSGRWPRSATAGSRRGSSSAPSSEALVAAAAMGD